MDADIEPDPSPAAQFHSHHLLVGENQDRTYLEENARMKEQSLVVNQKIAHLSTEISNSAIGISQTINYVQLRYLTQMLDAAEHVTSQKRSRAMSNNFLSDMLSRGVKKVGPSSSKNTCTISTQTPPAMLTAIQLQQQQQFQQQFIQQHLLAAANGSFAFRAQEAKLAKSGYAIDDRSQLGRQGIPPDVHKDLKGSPTSPDSNDLQAASRSPTPLPKFQTPSVSSGSQDSSAHRGTTGDSSLLIMNGDGPLKRPSSEISLSQLKVGGKYPSYPYRCSSRSPIQKSVDISTASSLNRSISQPYLSPEMAIQQ
ncbi:MAG: hypothetical protein J3Q66DRAFT_408817 [Benniella sp.]|nr:MAG: hypothetical protein J3Q66DRAFT_408817 [Benniella sp.]